MPRVGAAAARNTFDNAGAIRVGRPVHVALAAGSLAKRICEDDYPVVLFWRDAAVAKGMAQRKPLARILDDMLSERARGLANLRHGLEAGLRGRGRSSAKKKEAIVFTDVAHNIEGSTPARGEIFEAACDRRFPRRGACGSGRAGTPRRVAGAMRLRRKHGRCPRRRRSLPLRLSGGGTFGDSRSEAFLGGHPLRSMASPIHEGRREHGRPPSDVGGAPRAHPSSSPFPSFPSRRRGACLRRSLRRLSWQRSHIPSGSRASQTT